MLPSLYSDRLPVQMEDRVILLFRISRMLPSCFLLKGLRNDVLDVWMYISPKLMKRIPKRTAHVIHDIGPLARRKSGWFVDTLLPML